jgi:hypothetical protein
MSGHALAFVLALMAQHWYTDFELQRDWQARNKSTDWDALLAHTGTYSLAMMVFLFVAPAGTGWSLRAANAWTFGLITFLCHTATDKVTSRITKRLWQEQKVHDFFVVVGFDQWLHLVQLLTTAWALGVLQ